MSCTDIVWKQCREGFSLGCLCVSVCIQHESECFVCSFCALRQNPMGRGHLCMVPLNPRVVLSVVEQCLSLFLFIRSYCMIISVSIIYLQLKVAVGAACCRLPGCMCRAGGASQPPGLLSNVVDSTGGGCPPGLLQGLLGSCSPGDQDVQAQHCRLPEMDLILDLTAEIQSILNKLPSTNAISDFSPKVSEQRPADTLFSAVFHF